MRVQVIFILLLLVLACTSFAFKRTLTGKIMHVVDGDTVDVQPIEGGQFFRCRLYGIDAPETAHRRKLGQRYGNEATRELKRFILGREVGIQMTGAKTYNREVCRIFEGRTDVNLEMVKEGYAWAYRHYLKRPYASEYMDAEREARAKKFGLWQDNNPTPPWEFRRVLRGR